MGDVIRNLPTQQARKILQLCVIFCVELMVDQQTLYLILIVVLVIKNYSPLLYMESATISSLTDIARPIMTEGLNAFFGTGIAV